MEIIRFEGEVKTSNQAAEQLGFRHDRIIKTLIFHDRDFYFVVILQGFKKVSYTKIKEIFGIRRPSMASADKVQEISGFPVGGVMPIFNTKLPVILDKAILEFDIVYGGGGDMYSLCKLSPQEIIETMNPIIEEITFTNS